MLKLSLMISLPPASLGGDREIIYSLCPLCPSLCFVNFSPQGTQALDTDILYQKHHAKLYIKLRHFIIACIAPTFFLSLCPASFVKTTEPAMINQCLSTNRTDWLNRHQRAYPNNDQLLPEFHN